MHTFGHSCCDGSFRLREENTRLRRRVEELEREREDGVFVSIIANRAEAAEAKLAETEVSVRRLTAEGMAFSAEVERLRVQLREANENAPLLQSRALTAEAKLAEAQEARDQAQQASGRLMDEVERLRDDAILLESLQVATERERDKRDRQWREAFDQAFALRAEVERLREEILKAEADIKALGFEAHPAVVMRMDRLVRTSRAKVK